MMRTSAPRLKPVAVASKSVKKKKKEVKKTVRKGFRHALETLPADYIVARGSSRFVGGTGHRRPRAFPQAQVKTEPAEGLPVFGGEGGRAGGAGYGGGVYRRMGAGFVDYTRAIAGLFGHVANAAHAAAATLADGLATPGGQLEYEPSEYESATDGGEGDDGDTAMDEDDMYSVASGFSGGLPDMATMTDAAIQSSPVIGEGVGVQTEGGGVTMDGFARAVQTDPLPDYEGTIDELRTNLTLLESELARQATGRAGSTNRVRELQGEIALLRGELLQTRDIHDMTLDQLRQETEQLRRVEGEGGFLREQIGELETGIVTARGEGLAARTERDRAVERARVEQETVNALRQTIEQDDAELERVLGFNTELLGRLREQETASLTELRGVQEQLNASRTDTREALREAALARQRPATRESGTQASRARTGEAWTQASGPRTGEIGTQSVGPRTTATGVGPNTPRTIRDAGEFEPVRASGAESPKIPRKDTRSPFEPKTPRGSRGVGIEATDRNPDKGKKRAVTRDPIAAGSSGFGGLNQAAEQSVTRRLVFPERPQVAGGGGGVPNINPVLAVVAQLTGGAGAAAGEAFVPVVAQQPPAAVPVAPPAEPSGGYSRAGRPRRQTQRMRELPAGQGQTRGTGASGRGRGRGRGRGG